MTRRYTRVITTPAAARAVRELNRPFVSLLTDFGSGDPSAAICRGVVLAIAPEALIVDITHEAPKFDVRAGALLLASALPYLSLGAHVAVVDPGVGTERWPVAVETARGDVLVGPDNGILLPGAERLGGVTRAHLLENPQYRLPVVSASFHGRDLFAPAAAHLAAGVPIEALGRQLDPASLQRLDWPVVRVEDGELGTSALYLDSFGNVKLAGTPTDLVGAVGQLQYGDALLVSVGGREPEPVPWVQTFGHVSAGDALLYEDSYGRLCLAQNQGSAAARFGIARDTPITIRRAPDGG